MQLTWKFMFNQYEHCSFCYSYVCKEEYAKFTYWNSISMGCAQCDRIFLTAVYDNDYSNGKKHMMEYATYHKYCSPVEFKKELFEKDMMYNDGKNFFFVHDSDDSKVLMSYGYMKSEWFIDKEDKESYYYHAFSKVGSAYCMSDNWYWVYM